MKRISYRDARSDLPGLITRVHDGGEAVLIEADYSRQALAILAPADEHSPGPRVNASELRKQFERLVTAARHGENTVIAARRRPLARLEPLTWIGDDPEPDRDPELWADVNRRIDAFLTKDHLARSYTPAQREAVKVIAARLAYDLLAVLPRHSFTQSDLEFDAVEHAIWAALKRVR